MKFKIIMYCLCVLLTVSCTFGQQVDIKREIVTNYVTPQTLYVNFGSITNICFTSNSINQQVWTSPYLEKIERELSEARKTVRELSYPKESIDIKWVWSNTIYTVTEKKQPTVSWTNSVCIKRVTTKTVIDQTIKTNIDVKVESVE